MLIDNEERGIERVWFLFESNELKVKFKNGKVQIFHNVESDKYEEFIQSESLDWFYNENIKGKYNMSEMLNS